MGALFDFQQGQAGPGAWHAKEAAPSLVLAAALLFSPYVAASATAHCTRLPSLISMLDGEEQYINLAHFLLICESGFFMWDTRVTLGVLQKFVYFSIAIVSTIAFQLGVFHF
ncbi:unnamed protein product [Effrenium voratum]|nr:unnamed protein product [Effrenium voratum]